MKPHPASVWPPYRMNLIYVGDPMCPWSYGFGKELDALRAMHPGLSLHIVAGGRHAGHGQALGPQGTQLCLHHWERVRANTSLPFDRAVFLARDRLVVDSEPASRAFVAARRLAPQADLLAVFRRLQHAFFAQGRDIDSGRTLAEVVVGELQAQGLDIRTLGFEAEWRSDGALAETRADFRLARMLGADNFPSLLLDTGRGIVELSPGYAEAGLLDMRLRGVMDTMPRVA